MYTTRLLTHVLAQNITSSHTLKNNHTDYRNVDGVIQSGQSIPNKFIIFAFGHWGKSQAETTRMIVLTGTLFQHVWPVTVASAGRSTVMFG